MNKVFNGGRKEGSHYCEAIKKILEVNFSQATFLLLMIPPNLTRRRWESLHSELTFVIIFEAFYQAVHTKMGWC